MIISASRRTDIPAFYADWFMNRIHAGFCCVANPFNPGRIARVSLEPEDVDAIVFWTRDPRGLLPRLADLDARGYRYYFLYTLVDYPILLEPHSSPFRGRLLRFRRLADRLGPERVIWRYDPIVLTRRTDPRFHLSAFERIAKELEGCTKRCVISLMHEYAKLRARMRALESEGFLPVRLDESQLERLMVAFRDISHARGMAVTSCAPEQDLARFGILPGSCIDTHLIERLFSITLSDRKDPGQRPACRCAVSRDIGAYDTCHAGCPYCYATGSHENALRNRKAHDPRSPALVPADPTQSPETGPSGGSEL
jgi:hypothetical protein